MNYFEFAAFEKDMPNMIQYIKNLDNNKLLKVYDVLFAYSQLSKGCAAENLMRMPLADFTDLIPESHLIFVKKLAKAKVKINPPLKRVLQRTKAYFTHKNIDYKANDSNVFRSFLDTIPGEYVNFRPNSPSVNIDEKYFVNLQIDFTLMLHDTSLEIAKRKLEPGFRYPEITPPTKKR